MAINWCPLSPKQTDFIANSTAKLNVADGAVRSGKTIACTIRWLTYVMTGPQGDLAMLGKSLGTLKRNVLNDLFDIVGKNHYRWIDRQQGEFELYGRRIYAIGAANEEAESRIRGATFAGAYCDEANLYPESVWNQLMARLSVPGALCFANCNPDSPFHWFYKNVLTNKNIKSLRRWRFLMEDNLSLSEEYMEQLKSMYSGVFYRRFIDGEWCVAEGLVHTAFDQRIHVRHIPFEELARRAVRFFIGCDQGTSTTTSWSLMVELRHDPAEARALGTENISARPIVESPQVGAQTRSGLRRAYADLETRNQKQLFIGAPRIHKVAEYYYDAIAHRRQKSDPEFVQDFRNWLKPYEPLIQRTEGGRIWQIYCDPAASSWDALLTKEHIIHTHGDNDVLWGINTVSGMLARNLYTIEPTCKNTIEEYRTYSWDPKAQEKGIDKPLKVHDHAVDSDRYAIQTYLKNRQTGVYRRV